MKKQIFTLLTFLVVCVTGVWSADTDPGFAGSTYLDLANHASVGSVSFKSGTVDVGYWYGLVGTSDYLVVSAYAAYQSIDTQKWVTVDGSGSSSRTWSALSPFKGSSFYHSSTTAKCATTQSGRHYYFKVKNCVSAKAYVKCSSSQTVYLKAYEANADGSDKAGDAVKSTSTTSTTATSIEIDGLDGTKVYKIEVVGSSTTNNDFYEIAFEKYDSRSLVPIVSFSAGAPKAIIDGPAVSTTLDFTPYDAGDAAKYAVTYSSSDESVATIDGSGNISAVDFGTATIIANISASADAHYKSNFVSLKIAVGDEQGSTYWSYKKTSDEDRSAYATETSTWSSGSTSGMNYYQNAFTTSSNGEYVSFSTEVSQWSGLKLRRTNNKVGEGNYRQFVNTAGQADGRLEIRNSNVSITIPDVDQGATISVEFCGNGGTKTITFSNAKDGDDHTEFSSTGTSDVKTAIVNAIEDGDVEIVIPSNTVNIYSIKLTPPTRYAIEYRLNGGTGTTPTQDAVVEGTEITLHNGTTGITAPTGKEFAGWLCNIDSKVKGGGSSYTMTAAPTTFTAQWRDPLPKYSVTYDLNGASGDAPTETNKTAGDEFSLAAAPSWTGYRFDGWLCNIDSEVKAAGSSYTMTGAPTTFTAQWTELDCKIYSLTGGIGSAEGTAGSTEVSATLLKLSNSAARIKLTPASGETFKSGDVITIGGYTGNALKKLGVYVKNAAGSSNIATAEVTNLGDFTVSAPLTADAEYVFLARIEGTTMNITTCEIHRSCAVGTDANLAYGTSEVETDANAVFTNPLTNANNLVIAGYKSSNTDVATVNVQTGQVTAVGVGETTITAYSAIQTKEGTIYEADNASYTLTNRPQVSGTISAAGWSTFSSTCPLNLSTIDAENDASVYYASNASGSIVTLSPTTATVPAGEGLMIKGTAGETFTIGVAVSGTAISGNLLKGQTTTGNVAASPESGAGTYHYVFGFKEQKSVVTEYGFYNLAAATSVPAGKAYLELTVEEQGAPSIIRIVDEENNATSIKALGSTEKAVKFIENGQLYILREGVVYDALGRKVR